MSDALTAMVRTSRSAFTNRIKNLKRDWDTNGANSNSPAIKMEKLNELFTMCVSTQGMSYFNGNSSVHTFSQARPNADYQNACQMFDCRNTQGQPTLHVPFSPDDQNNGQGTVSDRFAQYQCAMNRSLDEKMIRLRRNITTTGSICGSDTSAQGR